MANQLPGPAAPVAFAGPCGGAAATGGALRAQRGAPRGVARPRGGGPGAAAGTGGAEPR